MNAISIKNPYAQLIAQGLKTLEIRTWKTNYVGDILICASKTCVYMYDVRLNEKLIDSTSFVKKMYKDMGFAVAVATLTGCRLMTPEDEDAAWCEYKEGHYAWMLENPRPLGLPFLVSGKQGLFNFDVELEDLCF